MRIGDQVPAPLPPNTVLLTPLNMPPPPFPPPASWSRDAMLCDAELPLLPQQELPAPALRGE